jgi:environmental stress-induced protein Ves
MTRHLTRADYLDMPWANGRGTTIEILREPAQGNTFQWRFSMATVAENGPFSLFPGINRNLTVIDGPGFDLIGEQTFRADPMRPVAFPGDLPLSAANVTAPAVDFNVMTQRSLPGPVVRLCADQPVTALSGATLCLFALTPATFGSHKVAPHDFLFNAPTANLRGTALVIQLFAKP